MGHLLTLFNTSLSGVTPSATPIVYDTFTDADATALTAHTIAPTNTPATVWTNFSNSMSVNSNAAKPNTDAALNASICDPGVADGIFSLSCNATNKANVLGLIFRYSDSNNHWLIERTDGGSGTQRIYLYRKQTGSYNLITTVNIDWLDGMEIAAITSGTSITCYVNAIPVISTTSAFNQSATIAGIYAVRTTHRIYDFSASQDSGVPNTVLKKYVFCGDSLTSGTAVLPSLPYPNQAILALHPTTPILNARGKNLGQTGRRAAAIEANQGASADAEYSATYRKNICVVWVGTNDLDDGTSAATTLGYISAFCTARRAAGFKVIVCTITPRTDFSGAKETARLALNSSIMSGYASFADAPVDLANTSGLTNAADAVVYPDGLHISVAGNTTVGAAIAAVAATL